MLIGIQGASGSHGICLVVQLQIHILAPNLRVGRDWKLTFVWYLLQMHCFISSSRLFYSQFMARETEVQSGKVTCPRLCTLASIAHWIKPKLIVAAFSALQDPWSFYPLPPHQTPSSSQTELPSVSLLCPSAQDLFPFGLTCHSLSTGLAVTFSQRLS